MGRHCLGVCNPWVSATLWPIAPMPLRVEFGPERPVGWVGDKGPCCTPWLGRSRRSSTTAGSNGSARPPDCPFAYPRTGWPHQIPPRRARAPRGGRRARGQSIHDRDKWTAHTPSLSQRHRPRPSYSDATRRTPVCGVISRQTVRGRFTMRLVNSFPTYPRGTRQARMAKVTVEGSTKFWL